MDYERRHKRLRSLIRKLNKQRKAQSKKTDILCNDLIAAQRRFVKTLGTISFTANFYKSIIGITDLSKLLNAANKLIREEINNINVTFFLRQASSFKLYMFESNQPIALEKHRLENCFNDELVEAISRANNICTLDELYTMGLEADKLGLKQISAATVPLGEFGRSLGFILVYQTSQPKLTGEELSKISAVVGGLSEAVQACQAISQLAG